MGNVHFKILVHLLLQFAAEHVDAAVELHLVLLQQVRGLLGRQPYKDNNNYIII